MEPSHEDIKKRFNAITEDLEGRLSPQGIFSAWQDGGDFDALNEERTQVLAEQKRLRPIALAEEFLKAKQQLAEEIAKVIKESGLEGLLGEPVRNMVYYSGDDLGPHFNVEDRLFEAQMQSTERILHPCACGCGQQVRKTFAQGHDGKLRRIINQIHDGRLSRDQLPQVAIERLDPCPDCGLRNVRGHRHGRC